jgi:protein-tyrosine phosphatase
MPRFFAVLKHHQETILFGKYPCEETFKDLEKYCVTVLVNLTNEGERLDPYEVPSEDIKVIKFPIPDRRIVKDQDALSLVKRLNKLMDRGKVIYIHCLGGHGRSAVIAGLLYGYRYGKSPEKVLDRVWEAHQARKVLKPQMRKLGAPQNKIQKAQIIRILEREKED